MPPMPQLPSECVNTANPFQFTGVDYFGPLTVRTGKQTKKVWVCLFNCMVVRAVHIELVEDMTTESFLMSVRRFIARRGKPTQIISDNGSNFRLGQQILKAIFTHNEPNPDIQSYLSQEQIEWKFIVQLAPWMGGFNERMVGVVKSALRKTIGKLMLSFTQLQTILCEVKQL